MRLPGSFTCFTLTLILAATIKASPILSFPNPPSTHISPRSPLSLTTWQQAITKGKQRQALIDAPPSPDTNKQDTSPFSTYCDLESHGWKSTLQTDASWTYESDVFDAIAKAYGMTSERMVKFDAVHGRSGGEFRGYVSTGTSEVGNTIFAMDNHSPRSRCGEDGVGVPDLQHWSDVAFLEYQESLRVVEEQEQQQQRHDNDDNGKAAEEGKGQAQNLAQVITAKISNPAAHAIINEAVLTHLGLTTTSSSLSFPGQTIPCPSDAFFTLLGTANGGSVARLLSDRKGSLGWKFVSSVNVVWDPRPGLPI